MPGVARLLLIGAVTIHLSDRKNYEFDTNIGYLYMCSPSPRGARGVLPPVMFVLSLVDISPGVPELC